MMPRAQQVNCYRVSYFCSWCGISKAGRPTGRWIRKEEAINDELCPNCGHKLRKKPRDSNFEEKYERRRIAKESVKNSNT